MWIKNNYRIFIVIALPVIIGFGIFCVTGILTKSWFDAQTNKAIIASAQLGALAWGIFWIIAPMFLLAKVLFKKDSLS